MKFLDSLKTYDKDNIPGATIKKIRDKYVPMASFNAKEVAKVSSGAFSFIKGPRTITGLPDSSRAPVIIGHENVISL